MVQINFALKEVNCKIVYYGPGLSGKTTNLEVVHSKAPTSHVGELTSIATEGDRTLFFDFLPLSLGQVAGMNTKFQIYTVPGQVYYNSTRKLVLQGADGIVFVVDSRRGKMDENLESLANLEENLREYGMDIRSTPLVLQYNKRDLPDIYTVEEMQEMLNKYAAPYFEAVAVKGDGVFPTLKKLSSMVLEGLNRQQTSTGMRRPPPSTKPAPAREAVAVGAGHGSGQVPTAPAAGARPRPPGSTPPSVGPTRRPGSPPGPAVERLGDSTRLNPSARRAPGAIPSASFSQPGAGGPALVKKRLGVQIPRPRIEEQRFKPKIIYAALIIILVGAAAVYFSGLWRHIRA